MNREAKGVAAAAVTDRRHGLARLTGAVRFLLRLPALALLGLIRVYQSTLSPALPILTMGRCACRFTPTCSHYAAEAIRTHGALAGTALAIARLVKCTPLHPGGFDPVPAASAIFRFRAPRSAGVSPASSTPRCTRVLTPSS